MIKVKIQKVGDMVAKNITDSYESAVINHFDGNSRRVLFTQKEVLIEKGEKIVSCTSPDGIITMANSEFVRMSGYTQKELIGAPHSILHHPDMPKIVFQQMWAELMSNGRWSGYVKNLRKDGGFYWVHASIFPNFRNGELVGYTSFREFAPRDKIEQSIEKYARLLEKEKIA